MQLFINGLSSQFALPFDESTTVGRIKSQIFEQTLIPGAEQRLIYGGKQFNADEDALTEYGVGDLHTINLLLRLRGGGIAAVVGPTAAITSAATLIADAAGLAGLSAGTTAATAGAGGLATALITAQSAVVATMAAATPFSWLVAGAAVVNGAIVVAGDKKSTKPVCWKSVLNSGELESQQYDYHCEHGILMDQLLKHCKLYKASDDNRVIVKNQKDEYFAFSISTVVKDFEDALLSDHHINTVTVVHAVPVKRLD